MVVVYLRNSLDPDLLVVPVTVGIELVNRHEEHRGEDYWILQFATHAKDVNGDVIPVKVVDVLGSITDVEAAIVEGLRQLGALVNWGTLAADTTEPYVDSYYPSESEDVPIGSNVKIVLKDNVPTSGVDPSTVVMTVNGIDITSQVQLSEQFGQLTIDWFPNRNYS